MTVASRLIGVSVAHRQASGPLLSSTKSLTVEMVIAFEKKKNSTKYYDVKYPYARLNNRLLVKKIGERFSYLKKANYC